MRFYTLAAAAAASLPPASGQRDEPRRMRGAAIERRLGGEVGDHPSSDAVDDPKAATLAKKTADLLTKHFIKNDPAAAIIDQGPVGHISDAWKYESSKWEARGIVADVSLNVDAFDEAVEEWSEANCGVGITATLFDKDSNMVYQKTAGTKYTPIVRGGYSFSSSPAFSKELVDGWTGDTVFTPFSNSKAVAAATYLASVVDKGLGYLDEPISATFEALKRTQVGQMTPRHMLSHTSGLRGFNRDDPENDPYYLCKYDASKTLRECVETHFFKDDSLVAPPGSYQAYNNEAFDILAVLAEEKTGLKNWGRIFKRFIANPLGMTSTTYSCPPVKSTSEKPGVAWGLCSTGNDYPKFVQMLSSGGVSASGEQVLSQKSINEMFSDGTGSAVSTGDLIWDGGLPFFMTRCYPRSIKGGLGIIMPGAGDMPFPLNSVAGYGLGTMFLLGNQGEIKSHGGSTGGTWLVAPGRFSAYLTWMCASQVAPEVCGNAYPSIADILNKFESASTVTLKNVFVENDDPQDIAMCGGFVDLFQDFGFTSTKDFTPPPTCDTVEEGYDVHPLHKALGSTAHIL